MRPDESQHNGRVGTPQATGRAFVSTPPSRDPQYRQREAAADIIRSQLDAIYGGESSPVSPAVPAQPAPTAVVASPTPTPEPHATLSHQPLTITQPSININPYERTHAPAATIQQDQWRAYHSAWQDYYKKYYEQYYVQAVKQVAAAPKVASEPSKTPIGSATLAALTETAAAENESTSAGSLTRSQAMQQLRHRLRSQVEASAKKARKSRHFVPIVAALGVVLIFGFVQYNQILVANVKAYITPGTIDPQNIIVNPTEDVAVSPEPRLIIPKINVDTPVFYDIGTDTASQNKAMENGVAHFAIPGANSHPGEIGNTVLSGHSSNDVFAAGDYKYIFMQLDRLEAGDTIYANYNSKRYTYTVTKKEEVLPTQVDRLIYTTDKPMLTLITCTPLGTALRRLLVTAEQTYPAASEAAPAPASTSGEGSTSLPSQSQPTLFERLFGA